jgi:hypothetical protein
VEVGDLVRRKGDETMGIVLAKNRVSTKYDDPERGKTLAMEYLVKLITDNKAAWYIQDSLELVNEGRNSGSKNRRPRKK